MSKTITVNVEESVEEEFRKFAGKEYGKRKGYLGKALTQAMNEWVQRRNNDIEARALKLLKSGIKMKQWKFNRDELHER